MKARVEESLEFQEISTVGQLAELHQELRSSLFAGHDTSPIRRAIVDGEAQIALLARQRQEAAARREAKAAQEIEYRAHELASQIEMRRQLLLASLEPSPAP